MGWRKASVQRERPATPSCCTWLTGEWRGIAPQLPPSAEARLRSGPRAAQPAASAETGATGPFASEGRATPGRPQACRAWIQPMGGQLLHRALNRSRRPNALVPTAAEPWVGAVRSPSRKEDAILFVAICALMPKRSGTLGWQALPCRKRELAGRQARGLPKTSAADSPAPMRMATGFSAAAEATMLGLAQFFGEHF
jgi:hypothetical protein